MFLKFYNAKDYFLNLFFFNKINELKKIILDVNFYIIDELFICLIFN